MTSDPIQDAIEFYRSGQSEKARSLLKQVIQQNPEDEAAWYWYVEMLPTLTARIRALETFLQIVPDNQKARLALNSLIKQRNDLQTSQPVEPAPEPDPPPVKTQLSQPKPVAGRKQQGKRNTTAHKSPLKKIWPIALLVLVIPGFFLLKPLFNSQPSPRSVYAGEIAPILENLESWNEGPILEWSFKMQSKDSWGISTYQQDIQDPVLRVIRRDELTAALVPLANQISQDGEAILHSMETITPPDEIAEQHYVIILCVEYQIHKAEATASFIQHDTISQLGEDHCQDFPDAFSEIENYINED
ncbi:MAG: tetratricopeptide repeat protein [Anaerolineales bacterium]|nr:tetratricopeptide repeat protein [Anaerolineales bacterium]